MRLLAGITVGILVAAIAGAVAFRVAANYGIDLSWPTQRAQTHAAKVVLQIEGDGSVDLAGEHFTDMAKLQTALMTLAKEKPKPRLELHIAHDKALSFEKVGRVVLAVQKSGLDSGYAVGFITEPPG